MYEDKELAKAIIMEIIRQAGGRLENKTNLFKAFYYAHLEFARAQPGFLSTWPIVRMPNGPGIDKCDRLLGELTAEGKLEITQTQKGQYAAFVFVAGDQNNDGTLPEGAVEAICRAISEVEGKTAQTVSDESHRRAWEAAKNGHEMNIYLDLNEPGSSVQADAEAVANLFGRICRD